MAPRACALLLLAIATVAARECIELTLTEKSLLTDSILNGTILKLSTKNESFDESGRFNVVKLWEQFPKIVVPSNGTSEQCRRDSQLYLDSLDRLELWALKSKYLPLYYLLRVVS
uniref:SFRICE_041482 n=1 Tax=Spodoptera frugiperda TaxID=7108 RepID=A0A2H1WXK0_SPOFR